jgi:hypothetical protein
MGLRRRVEITILRSELTLGVTNQSACEVHMLPVELAARASKVSPRIVYRWIEQNQVHYRELSDGTVLVCENSLRSK